MSKANIDGPNGEQGKAWWFLDQLVVEHPNSPGAQTVVLEMTLPVGSSAPLHIHDDLDDSWFILEGEMVVRCGDEVRSAFAGEWLTMPRGIPHTFRVVGDREARILLVHDNATFRDFVREIGVPAESRIMPPQPIFPAVEELARVGANHRVRPIGPPMSAADCDAVLARA